MSTIKKNIFIVLSMTVFILSACNSDDTNTTSSTENTNENQVIDKTESDQNTENNQVGTDSSDDSSTTEETEEFAINNMIDTVNIETEGGWMKDDGSIAPHSEFSITEAIEYNPEKTYSIGLSGYITYYENDDFIKTVRYSKEVPTEIESVSNANFIKISYRPNDLN